MPDDEDFFAKDVWDEYDWERFLQEQDRTTEKYFGLLDKYEDHPDRDALIAKEMGWENGEADVEIEEIEGVEELEFGDDDSEQFHVFSRSPIYRDTLRLHRWISLWIESDEKLKDHPYAVSLATRAAICGAKLSAALCGDDEAEIGMTIAYLKRALKAANDALESCAKLTAAGMLSGRQPSTVRRLIFRIRDQVIILMNEYRAEWRKRHG